MNTSSTWRRVIAFGIDSFVASMCLIPFRMQLWGAAAWGDKIAVEWQWLVVVLLLQLFYSWMFLYFLGGTLGKLFLGLRVVPRWNENESLGLLQSLLRVLADHLSFFFGLAPRAVALLRLDRTHISDWVAETRVIQESPQKQLMRRHWLVALFVIWMSFTGQFQRVYHLLSAVELEGGEIVFDMQSQYL